MSQKQAKERRALLDQMLTARASTPPAERPAPTPRQLGPIAEQANVYLQHVGARAKLYDDAKAEGRLLLELDPKVIRATKFQNRDARALLAHDPKFITLTKSIGAHGQETPIRIRPAPADASPYEFEIVSGHRRHAACLALDASSNEGFKILALIDAAASETKDLVLKMYRENEEREDLSPHETGRSFRLWLDSGVFPTAEAIAQSTGQSAQNVGRYLALAALPDFLIAAFRDPREISLRWAPELSRASQADSETLKALAQELAKREPAPSPEKVFQALTAAAPKKKRATSARASEAIKEGNKTLFELSSGDRRFGIRLGKHVDKQLHKTLKAELREWLHAWLKQHSQVEKS